MLTLPWIALIALVAEPERIALDDWSALDARDVAARDAVRLRGEGEVTRRDAIVAGFVFRAQRTVGGDERRGDVALLLSLRFELGALFGPRAPARAVAPAERTRRARCDRIVTRERTSILEIRRLEERWRALGCAEVAR